MGTVRSGVRATLSPPARPSSLSRSHCFVRQVLGAVAERKGDARRQARGGASAQAHVDRQKGRGTQVSRRGASGRRKLAKALARKKPKGGNMSLRAISAALAEAGYLNERGRAHNPKSVAVMLASRPAR